MEPEERPTWAADARGSSATVRRRVIDVAAEVLRDPPLTGQDTGGATGTPMPVIGVCGRHTAMTVYLALLQDRLPVYVRALRRLRVHAGKADVAVNLSAVALATIDFYLEMLEAKVAVFADVDQLLRLRRALRTHGIGPQAAQENIAVYLEDERRLGRVEHDADCAAAAHLLVGACLNYAFTRMMLDDLPAPADYVADLVRGLRIIV